MTIQPDDFSAATLFEFRGHCARLGMCVCWHSGDENVTVFAMPWAG